MQKKRILIVMGTRPEAIKLAPLIHALKQYSHIDTLVVSTGQHTDMLQSALDIFQLTLDDSISVMSPGQSLSELTAKLFHQLESLIVKYKPDIVVGQGDTHSVAVSSMLAFFHKIPFAHVEAGLRSHDLQHPFPEEFNRRVAALASTLHFAPTDQAKNNLQIEGIPESNIFVSGNTVIDALKMILKKDSFSRIEVGLDLPKDKKIVLLTVHRRETQGQLQGQIFESILELSQRYPDLYFIYPLHPNPYIRFQAQSYFRNQQNVDLREPMSYEELIGVMKNCFFIMTDSGGIQEEAPLFGKPILVLRNETEREEIIQQGMGCLVGANKNQILKTVDQLMKDHSYYQSFQKFRSPYGDGKAGIFISHVLSQFLTKEKREKNHHQSSSLNFSNEILFS